MSDCRIIMYLKWRKCKVDASTESDSDTKNEILSTSTPVLGSSRKPKDFKYQFLDPYDGDSEDTSSQSDCSLSTPPLIDVDVKNAVQPVRYVLMDLEDPISETLVALSNQEAASNTCKKTIFPVLQTLPSADVTMQAISDSEIHVDKVNGSFALTENEMDSDVFIESSPFLNSGQFAFNMHSAGLPGNSESRLELLSQKAKLIPEFPSKNTSSKGLSKRKPMHPLLDTGGEKMCRKKLCVNKMESTE
nr:PREDICTED: uncharacterized protein LOC106704523 [Latimeria chalumnae]|eukprot:XP_014347214.1 PREDICTED: uncharacterized protein LOC106704523 [Latimeria chalumnae]